MSKLSSYPQSFRGFCSLGPHRGISWTLPMALRRFPVQNWENYNFPGFFMKDSVPIKHSYVLFHLMPKLSYRQRFWGLHPLDPHRDIPWNPPGALRGYKNWKVSLGRIHCPLNIPVAMLHFDAHSPYLPHCIVC